MDNYIVNISLFFSSPQPFQLYCQFQIFITPHISTENMECMKNINFNIYLKTNRLPIHWKPIIIIIICVVHHFLHFRHKFQYVHPIHCVERCIDLLQFAMLLCQTAAFQVVWFVCMLMLNDTQSIEWANG